MSNNINNTDKLKDFINSNFSNINSTPYYNTEYSTSNSGTSSDSNINEGGSSGSENTGSNNGQDNISNTSGNVITTTNKKDTTTSQLTYQESLDAAKDIFNIIRNNENLYSNDGSASLNELNNKSNKNDYSTNSGSTGTSGYNSGGYYSYDYTDPSKSLEQNTTDVNAPGIIVDENGIAEESVSSLVTRLQTGEKFLSVGSAKAAYTDVKDIIVNAYNSSGVSLNTVEQISESFADLVSVFSEYNITGTAIDGTIEGIGTIMANNLRSYQDGISETSFGAKMEESWYGSDYNSFLNYFQKTNRYNTKKVNILSSTPLDGGKLRDSIYGSMILGTPFLFNQYSDPTNRTLINSLVKDGRYVSFTPGYPKYNGSSYTASENDSILNQTQSPIAMLEYLTKNGIDSTFSEKDKRYYTFKTDYSAYFAYLETMLNALWIKMGLAKNGQEFNLFSFFDIKSKHAAEGINAANYNKLLEQYNSSIGFFINGSNVVSESVDSSPSNHGDDLASRANQNAADYQRLNYITGMGQGGDARNIMRKIGIGLNTVDQAAGLLRDSMTNTIDAISNVRSSQGLASKIISLVSVPIAIAKDVTSFSNTQDLGALLQSFATTNGMMVRYPNMWADSGYSKNINLEFSFVSPYGDPLSIFKYVYVPFCALLAFSLPRQAAENGLVSPFLVRCDIPGMITSDLALISSMTWTKGGDSNLWTKDGLPRALRCSVTVNDLYPYLAMSKRLSFLSANPSYAVFLDNMSGMLALNDTSEDSLNSYFRALINRVNGAEEKGYTLWNKFNSLKSEEIQKMTSSIRSSLSATVDINAVPWLHNSSL